MRRVYTRVGKKIRTIEARNVSQKYEVKYGEALGAAGSPAVSSMGCTVPVRGARRTVGVQFKATGQHHGWRPPPYIVKAKIVRGKSTAMDAGTFRNVPSALGSQAYMRFGQKYPIKKTLGPAIPEMTSHLAEPGIQREVLDTLEKRMQQEMMFILK